MCNVNECASIKCVVIVIEMKALGFFYFFWFNFSNNFHQSDNVFTKKHILL
jgi:hypothetical protein